MTAEAERNREHELERASRPPRGVGNNSHNSNPTTFNNTTRDAHSAATRRDPPYGNLNLKDNKHRDTRDTGRGVQAGAVGSWGGTGRARDGKAASRSASKTRRRSGKVEVSKEETERLLKEQEAEREAKAREDREKLKETRKVYMETVCTYPDVS